MYLSTSAARIKDLQKEIQAKTIVFSDSAIIVLMGCNTTSLEENIAKELALATQRPVVGPNQKINLFQSVETRGETMVGLENKSFLVYYFNKDKLCKYDLATNQLTLTEAIKKVKNLVNKPQ